MSTGRSRTRPTARPHDMHHATDAALRAAMHVAGPGRSPGGALRGRAPLTGSGMLGPASWPFADSTSVVRPFAFRRACHVATPTPPRRRPDQLPAPGARGAGGHCARSPAPAASWFQAVSAGHAGGRAERSAADAARSGSSRLPTQGGAFHPQLRVAGGLRPRSPPARGCAPGPATCVAERERWVWRGEVVEQRLCCSSGSVRIEDELTTQDGVLHPHHGLPGGSAPLAPREGLRACHPRRGPASGGAAASATCLCGRAG